MNITPETIEQSGPGIDLSEHPEGYAIKMSDPVRDLEYALNKVTFVFDLAGYGGGAAGVRGARVRR